MASTESSSLFSAFFLERIFLTLREPISTQLIVVGLGDKLPHEWWGGVRPIVSYSRPIFMSSRDFDFETAIWDCPRPDSFKNSSSFDAVSTLRKK